MIPKLSIGSVNAKGLCNDIKRKAIYAKTLNTDFCFIEESHVNSIDFKIWKSQWDHELFSSFLAGVLTLKQKFKGKIIERMSDPEGLFYWLL